MADPTLPNDPNTQAYKSDFLAGKFAAPTVENTPEHYGSIITPQQEAGFQKPNTSFIDSEGLHNGVASAVDSANNYYNAAARHHSALNHAHRQTEAADYMQQAGQIDPTSETALEEHINNKSLFPGALGDDVDASDQHFATIYNQHQRATGQGWNTIQNDIKAGYITQDQIKRLPDGSVDYYSTHMLANEQGGALARQKAALSEETPEAKLFARALEVHKIPEPDVYIPGSEKVLNPDYAKWALHKAWADTITEKYMQSHPNFTPPITAAKATTAGPSAEFQATAARFKTPSQVESIPKSTALPMKGTAITGPDQYFSR